MSNVNIRRAVENIRSGTTVYTPLVEMVVNAIQAIEAAGQADGEVTITVLRSGQRELDGTLPAVESFRIADNGIGFDRENRDHFDTLYTDHKTAQGGKGFGRFICLKYFRDSPVDSVYLTTDGPRRRTFRMGKATEIIVDEKDEATDTEETGSVIELAHVKDGRFTDKSLPIIARYLVERLLPYFIDKEYKCPVVVICDADGSDRIVLNDFVQNELSASIREILLSDPLFTLGPAETPEGFTVRIFKVYVPRNQRSKISLVAHRREVTDTAIHNYVPEFVDEFFDAGGDTDRDRNYIVKAYVFGAYLDRHVSLERGGFEFQKDSDMIHGISQAEIEGRVAEIARTALGEDITARQEKKRLQVCQYVEEHAPWHRTIAEDIDLSSMPYNPMPEQIETVFQKEKFAQETAIRRQVEKMLSEADADGMQDGLRPIIDQISRTSRNDLIHYIALRKHVLRLFSRSLELTERQRYPSEGTVHDIIFPRKGDLAVTALEDHNLWIIDERLNFTNFVSSDKPLDGGTSERPDVVVSIRRSSSGATTSRAIPSRSSSSRSR